LTRARIIFVPGLNPKPPPDTYRAQLLRILLAGLRRTRPRSAAWLARHDESFVLVAWTYLFYGAYRDISIDLPGIEQLLTESELRAADLKELRSWRRRFLRWLHLVGDRWPLLGRAFAPANTRLLLHEANRYLKDRDGAGAAVRAVLRAALESAWRDDAAILLIGHSLGSVIAYDTLWELTHVQRVPGKVDLLLTMGSPLGTRFVQRSLQGCAATGAERYPHNVRRWVNLTARGDTTALKARLKPSFREMLELGLVESIDDHADFDSAFRSTLGLNAHDAYGYLSQRLLAELVGEWLERSL
jgi:hypothetical protein